MGIVDTLKDVAVLVQKADNIELVKKIIGLQAEIGAMMEENRALKETARKLEDALELKTKMHFDKDAYWTGAGRKEADGPYCPRCFDVDRRPVRMVQQYGNFFRCTQCKTSVEIEGVKPPRDAGPLVV